MEVKKRTQIRFNRIQDETTGKFKTKVKFERSANYTPALSHNRGFFHKATNFTSNRLVGDVPSFNNLQPKSLMGQKAVDIAKGAESVVKNSLHFANKTTLVAENTLLVASDFVRRKNRLQLNFNRNEDSTGKFKTKAHFEFADSPRLRQKGIIHKAVGFKQNFFVGDVPSLQRKLHSFQPQTLHGKAAKFTAIGTESVVRNSFKAVTKTGLKAENVFYKMQAPIKRQANLALRNKVYQLQQENDIVKGFAYGVGAITTTHQLIQSRHGIKSWLNERHKLKNLKTSKLFSKQKNKNLYIKNKDVFKPVKKAYKLNKKSYKDSVKTDLQKSVHFRRKQIYKDQKKDFKSFKHTYKKNKRLQNKLPKKQKKVVKYQRKVAFEPAKEVVRKPGRAYWYQLAYADPNNDFISAANKSYQMYTTLKRTPHQKFNKAQNKFNKKKTKSNKQQGKLKSKDTKLKNKNYKQAHKKKKYVKKRNVNNKINKVRNTAQKFHLKILLYILIIFLLILALILPLQCCAAIFSNSGWVMGTYTVKDEDISDVEMYYTKIAWNYNKKVCKIGNRNTWKSGLRDFDVDTTNYDDTPDNFIFGRSTYFPYDSVFDYDPYTLISFLCAYFYDYEDDDVKYWEFDSDVKDVLDQLFDKQYKFQHHYDNTSRWQQKYNYTFKGGGGASNGSYYTVYGDEIYPTRIKAASIPSEIHNFCDDDGYIHYDHSTLEILDAKHNNKRTGWFFQDQRYYVTSPSGSRSAPFFYQDENGEYAWLFRHRPKYREYLGWSDTDQAWWVVPRLDSYLWNSENYNGSKCLVSFYQKNEWVTDCRLYYTVKQLKTLDEAAKEMLSQCSNSSDRLNYYKLLTEGDGSNLQCIYGGHQCLKSPINVGFKELLQGNWYYNRYGWDIQDWNEQHCSLDRRHWGTDISLSPNSSVYAMVGGEITEYDTNENKVVIETTDKLKMWDEKRHIRITYYNVSLQSLHEGDTVTIGERIGVSNSRKLCDNGFYNQDSRVRFLHINVEVYDWGWKYVDPQLLINFS